MRRILFALFFISMELTAQKVATYNVGLAHGYVPYAKERIPYLIEKIKNSDIDLWCLQEVWRQEDREAFLTALSKVYPYAHFTEVKNDRAPKAPTCSISELFGKEGFLRCSVANCIRKKGDQFTSCVLEKCGEKLVKLKNNNRVCASALMAQVGEGLLKGIAALLNPFRPATMFAYGGGDGLLILSKTPLINKHVLDFTKISTLNRRRALLAEIEGDQQIACTHLGANLSREIPYPGLFSSWEEENGQQVEKLLELKELKEGKSILLGDFNCSFESSQIKGDFQKNCQKFKSFGLFNSFQEKNEQCSFCGKNPLTSKGSADVLIDHIWTNFTNMKSSHLFSEELHRIKTEEGNVEIPLSDHYGLVIEM